jgi:uncharacterized integral membrane protein
VRRSPALGGYLDVRNGQALATWRILDPSGDDDPGNPGTGSAGAIEVIHMSVSPTDSGEYAAPEGATPPVPDPAVAPAPPTAPRDRAVPRTRWSAAWAGICAAALALVALIVFMLQNTGSVEVTFLWMHGTLPLAMALLIAAVGAAILTMVFGAGRITQLRRLARRRRE